VTRWLRAATCAAAFGPVEVTAASTATDCSWLRIPARGACAILNGKRTDRSARSTMPAPGRAILAGVPGHGIRGRVRWQARSRLQAACWLRVAADRRKSLRSRQPRRPRPAMCWRVYRPRCLAQRSDWPRSPPASRRSQAVRRRRHRVRRGQLHRLGAAISRLNFRLIWSPLFGLTPRRDRHRRRRSRRPSNGCTRQRGRDRIELQPEHRRRNILAQRNRRRRRSRQHEAPEAAAEDRPGALGNDLLSPACAPLPFNACRRRSTEGVSIAPPENNIAIAGLRIEDSQHRSELRGRVLLGNGLPELLSACEKHSPRSAPARRYQPAIAARVGDVDRGVDLGHGAVKAEMFDSCARAAIAKLR